jgi:hypothetical protein
MAASSEAPDDFVYLKIPRGAWATLEETLQHDALSHAFDKALREEIEDALEQIEHLSPGEAVPA